MNKRQWYKHYDSMSLQDAIKILTDTISELKSGKDKFNHSSFILDLEAQRDEYKRRLNV